MSRFRQRRKQHREDQIGHGCQIQSWNGMFTTLTETTHDITHIAPAIMTNISIRQI